MFICQPGFEALLSRELAARGLGTIESGSGWVRTGPASADVADLAFAHWHLIEPGEFQAPSVNAMARVLEDAFSGSVRSERIEGPWPSVWQASNLPVGLGKRAAAAQGVFQEQLSSRLPRVARLGKAADWLAEGRSRGWFVWFCDFHRAFAGREAFFGGARRMSDDPAAPSRSYLKLEEAYGLIGEEPAAGHTAADLGAAPGGWSFSAAKRGAHVVAVDNGPLKGGARDHPLIEHRRSDAFGFRPDRPIDWLLCDLVEDPRKVLRRIVRPWLENGWCRRFVVNLKFGRVDPLSLLEELRSAESPLRSASSFRIRHLYHDREEFTVVGSGARDFTTP